MHGTQTRNAETLMLLKNHVISGSYSFVFYLYYCQHMSLIHTEEKTDAEVYLIFRNI